MLNPTPALRAARTTTGGFSLIELMVAVAIVALLSAIALPSYTAYITRAARADARTQLLQVAQFLQRFYSANDSYATDRSSNAVSIPASLNRSPADGTKLYDFGFATGSPTATTYRIQMVPVAGGIMANDECGTFQLDSTGVRSVVVSGTTNTSTLRDRCWK